MALSTHAMGARPALAAPRTELSAYDAMGLAELIRTKKITAAEAVEDVIRKIEAVNPKLNAVINKTYERARQRVKDGVGTGPFAGVPIVVKDNATITGVRLTRGSRAFRDNLPEKTAPFFEALERAGFVLVGVTNMPELGIIDGTENALYGPTHNPWNLEYSPGGSSGGSAACVASGVLPLAHGTDGGGSIRIPASHCALFGLKASRGRLLPGGFGAPPWPRLVEAGLSRTVRDTAMYLSVGEDPNTALPKLGFVAGKAARRLKVAVSFEGASGQIPDPQVRSAIADTASLCSELGHTVSEQKIPLDQPRVHAAAKQIASIAIAKLVDATAQAQGLTRLEDGFESRAIGIREEAIRKGPFDTQVAEALPILKEGTAALDRFFQEWDVLLTPVVRTPVYKIGMRDQSRYSFDEMENILRDYVAYTALHNICGTTAMSVPLHWDTNGLPLGSQFAARMGGEATLLSLAYELEEARPWAGKRPPTFVE
jgi:Asp-tRNA(Asn)/Glu-tRNA(Gln) amidotransferase A subunit family amidase